MTSTSTPVSCEAYEDLGKNIYIPSHNLFDIRSLCFFRTSRPEPSKEDQADGKPPKKKDVELIRRFMDAKFPFPF